MKRLTNMTICILGSMQVTMVAAPGAQLFSERSQPPIESSYCMYDGQKPASLQKIVNANSEFKIDIAQATAILEREDNKFYDANNAYLKHKTFPKVDDFEAFYVYGEEIRADLIGRAMAEEQNIVWGTGTHTDTPVAVVALGPKNFTEKFSSLSHHSDIGQLLIQAVKIK